MRVEVLILVALLVVVVMAVCTCNKGSRSAPLGNTVVMPKDWPVPELAAPPGAKPALVNRQTEQNVGKYEHILRYLPTELDKELNLNPRIVSSIAIAFTSDLDEDAFFDFIEKSMSSYNLLVCRNKIPNRSVYSVYLNASTKEAASMLISIDYNSLAYYDEYPSTPLKICTYDVTLMK
jgi:hypothetical protein